MSERAEAVSRLYFRTLETASQPNRRPGGLAWGRGARLNGSSQRANGRHRAPYIFLMAPVGNGKQGGDVARGAGVLYRSAIF